jgi:hypothetical protein
MSEERPKAKRRRGPTGQTIGALIAGLDYQVFRTTPPPHELVRKGAPVRGLTGEGGVDLAVVFPDDASDVPPDRGADRAVPDEAKAGDAPG